MWDQWKHRNMVLHNELDEEPQEGELTLNMELTREHRIRPLDLPQWTAFLFLTSIKNLLQTSPEYQRSWTQSLQAACWSAARCHKINQCHEQHLCSVGYELETGGNQWRDFLIHEKRGKDS